MRQARPASGPVGSGVATGGDAACERHRFEQSAGRCKRCRYPYCNECLVFPFGLDRPPLCIACAVDAGGVRPHAGVRPAPRVRKRFWDRVERG